MRQKNPRQRVLRLRQLRREREWTQRELGARVDMDLATICRIERGQQEPSLSQARSLAAVFGQSVESVFDYVEVPA